MTSIADIKRVFIDTSAWIDLMNSNERHHTSAVTFHKSLAPMALRNQKLSYVDAFSIALIQSRPDIDAVFAFDHHMALAGIPVLPGTLDRGRQ